MEKKRKLTNEEILNQIFVYERKIHILNREISFWFATMVIGILFFVLSFIYLGNKNFIVGGTLSIIGIILFIKGLINQRKYSKVYEKIGGKEGEEEFNRLMPDYKEKLTKGLINIKDNYVKND